MTRGADAAAEFVREERAPQRVVESKAAAARESSADSRSASKQAGTDPAIGSFFRVFRVFHG